ncbi:pyruvate dehydrogenase complex dihydrolipoyllysine-residue acetyltransferase [Moraxella osloensis]|uniref:Dihydrolipoamide acetyltransferase component of pyruvate dehydrogenase complex n=1 Tax=Faucicola osloensis TaxID=34062 RepID=A0AAD0EXA0_FAUOS|nr:2-oxo acid dehydrogenase subunit E2 [Moraxella osloensis]ATQ83342.1 pyruvate dehydrogenase complex dihydrolipoyllysine-residue acetyltransferase [Moraxella osloensis]ATW85836.1 pyruvate dehydrogenase complex dihydrolipoyllysine-residue acetyltransferase [Moraxella osloensis]
MEIKVPDLGVDSAEVSEIMVKVGDVINVDDNIVLLESDKASVEVPATSAGTITAINLQIGDKVKEGDVILTIDSAGNSQSNTETVEQLAQQTDQQVAQSNEAREIKETKEANATSSQAPSMAASNQSQPTSTSAEATYTLPDLGVDSAEISEWLVKEGDTVTAEQPLVLVESDKASVEVPAPVSGKIVKFLVNAGDTVANGQDFIVMTSQAASQQPLASDPSEQAASQATSAANQNEPPAQTVSAPQSSTPAGKQTFGLPDLGVESAQISEWMVKVGDEITAEQPLLLVESDKASVEVPSPVAGKVVELLVNAGDTVTNGQDFVVIEAVGSVQSASSSASQPQATTHTAQQEVAKTQNTASTATNSASTLSSQSNSQSKLSESQINAKNAAVYAGPAVRKLTRQLGVDVSEVTGTGANGRIVKEDVFAYVKNTIKAISTPTAANKDSAPSAARSGLPNLPDMSKTEIWGEIERQDLTRLQKVSIPQLNYNTYLPQVTQFDLADITDVEKLRGDLKDEMKKEGVSLTILAFIMKVTAYALMQHPKFNSHLSNDNTQIIIRKSVNLGFAVATEEGLTVPVIQRVEQKGIKQLAIEIGELAKKARDKKLSAKELTGASFTISSQGNLGGTYFTPLVNWPQVAILGISESSIQPRWNETKGEFEPRLMLPLSLSYDHRVINGADAAVFTRYIAKLLADPRRVLL